MHAHRWGKLVNFFTSNSENHRRYVLGLMFLALIPAFGLFLLGIYLEPLYGDLTRIGLHSEREFGWSKPQLKFSKPLYTDARYSRYHDVVVLGDSFSRVWPQHQWQNYLVSATDWSVVTLDINTIKLEHVLQNRVFRETPPKIFVYESVERELPSRIISTQPCIGSEIRQSLKQTYQHQFIHAGNLENTTRYVEREKNWSDVKLGFVLKYLWHGSWRSFLNEERTDTRKIALSQVAPFSSANRQEMLVYKDDLKKISPLQQLGEQEYDCRIERMRQQVEANGKTRFVLIVAPDKLTAYSDFISDEKLRNISKLSQFSERHKKVIPRIDLALKLAIRNGEQDIYLPDDTHWGSSGHRIAAESFLVFLQSSE